MYDIDVLFVAVSNFIFFIAFDDVAYLNVVASIDVKTAVLTSHNLLDIILESAQRTEFSCVDDNTVADEAYFGVALQFAIENHATGHISDL